MPKEQINTPERRIVSMGAPPAPGDEFLSEDQKWASSPALFVCWSKSASGETGCSPVGGSLELTFAVDTNEVLRAAALIERSRDLGVAEDAWHFETVMFTRPEAQKLIAVMRRARDAVFGGDE